MTAARPPDSRDEAFWRDYLTRGSSLERYGRQVFKHIPTDPRCKICAAPFRGIGAPVMRLMGKRPSDANPRMCNSCFSFISRHHGGAEIEATHLFADVRGSTSLAESMSPADFHHLMDRYYSTATKIVFDYDGAVDKFVGDELVAMFFPLLTGERHAARAIDAAQALLRATGHASISGFRETRCKTVFRMSPGDSLLCYLTGVSRWIAVLEVTGSPFKSTDRIWKDEVFPCRVPVRVVLALKPETSVPVLDLRDKLSVFQGLKNPNLWSGAFRGSPARWKTGDGDAIVAALTEAANNPKIRPVDTKKLARRPVATSSEIGPVIIPDEEIGTELEGAPIEEAVAASTVHTEIQALLLKLGMAMGLDVWVAANDRSRIYQGTPLGAMPGMRGSLPTQFAAHAQKIVSLIDVLWLDGTAIVAAFEVESTTSIYSGLLRMADLLALQPNVTIPLYIVAPDDRRDRVLQEVNRPTFSRLKLAEFV